jgi:arginine utilization protein RocB
VLRAIELIAALKGPSAARATGGAPARTSPADRGAASQLTGGAACELLGVLNVDYTTERWPGDPDWHAWEGTIGKLLAGVYVRGYQTHAGEYFRGFHAMGLLSRLVTAIDGSNDIAGNAPPPVTLRVADAKDGYNVMTSPAGWAYFNIFTAGETPARVMEILRGKSAAVVAEYLEALNRSFRAYGEAAGIPAGGLMWEVPVVTWSGLLGSAVERIGERQTESLLAAVRASMTGADIRETAFAMAARLLDLAGGRDPAVVLMFLPPFYPYISPDAGPFGSAVRGVLHRRAGMQARGRAVTCEKYYPYISDMSYLRLEPEIRSTLGGLTGEMPSWGRGYSLDFETIGLVDLPVVNVGPYGFGAHQPEERMEKEYSFRVLPELIGEIVSALK